MSESVRDRVKALQVLMLGEMTPDLARKSLVHLTGLQGVAAEHLRGCDLGYKAILRDAMRDNKAANRAQIEAECSSEYAEWREAKDVHESIKQMIVTCRAYLRSLDEEMRLTR